MKPTNTASSLKRKTVGVSSVIKQPISIPVRLFKWIEKEVRKVAKSTGPGVRPNISAFVVSHLQAAKDSQK